MSITNLTGTTWYFNSPMTSALYEGYGGDFKQINFTSNGESFIGIKSTYEIDMSMDYSLIYETNGQPVGVLIDTTTWSSETYRTISIIDGDDVEDSDLIAWLEENAQLISGGLIGTTWKFNKILSSIVPDGSDYQQTDLDIQLPISIQDFSNYLSNNYGVTPFSTWTGFISSFIEWVESWCGSTVTSSLTVNGSDTGSTTYTIYSLEFENEDEFGHFIVGNSVIDLSFISGTYSYDGDTYAVSDIVTMCSPNTLYDEGNWTTKSRVVTVLPCGDALDQDIIEWFEANAFPYNPNFSQVIDLSSLNLSSGTHTIKAKSLATGYQMSQYSNTRTVSLLSITTNITNGTYSGQTAAFAGGSATVTLVADDGYELPDTITVTNASYSYNSASGQVILTNISGNVTITAVCSAGSTAYIIFSSIYPFTIQTYNSIKNWSGTIEYKAGSSWTTWSGSEVSAYQQSELNYEIKLRGTGNTNICTSNGYRFIITGTAGSVNCTGNIETLLDYATVENNLHPSMDSYCFYSLFSGCTALRTPPQLSAVTLSTYCYKNMFYGCTNLIEAPTLPSTTMQDHCYSYMFYNCSSLTQAPALNGALQTYCYEYMFYGCSGLTSAPALPKTTLKNYCYQYMFQGCTGLTATPSLPATTLTSYCYRYMFYGCENLTTITNLPATSLNTYCCHYMFYGCKKLTSVPNLLAGTLKTYCYAYMFYGCSSLITPPSINATTLAGYCCQNMFTNCTALTSAPTLRATATQQYCYSGMFQGCTALTTAPDLPATTMTSNCYRSMFSGCTNLTTAPSSLSATTVATYSYAYMFQNCSKLTSVPALPATTLNTYCYSNMFDGCTQLQSAPALNAQTVPSYAYQYMFQNCKALVTPPALPATTLNIYCYRYMFYGCTNLTTAPELPATTLATYCYNAMFYGCTKLATIPTLPAITLTNYCYNQMFRNCSLIKISASNTGIYVNAYRIPTTGTGTTASNALTNMFTGTGGTFKTTAVVNTTYYTSNTIV